MSELTYHNKLVRDLAYLINGDLFLQPTYFNCLVSETYVKELADEFQPVLEKLAESPTPLAQHIADCPTHIIGKYAEDLMRFFIESHPRLDLLLHNFQVVDKGITLSEIDFIFKDLKSGKVHHWELSYKFYLHYQGAWIGPNARDTLKNKLSTVETRQLPLVTHHSVKTIIPDDIESSLYLKCHLFEEFNFDMRHKVVWLRKSELEKVDGRQDYWCLLPKTYWFSPVEIAPRELDAVRWPEVIKHCKNYIVEHNKSVLIARLEKRHGLYYETQRIFVVPDTWPTSDSQ